MLLALPLVYALPHTLLLHILPVYCVCPVCLCRICSFFVAPSLLPAALFRFGLSLIEVKDLNEFSVTQTKLQTCCVRAGWFEALQCVLFSLTQKTRVSSVSGHLMFWNATKHFRERTDPTKDPTNDPSNKERFNVHRVVAPLLVLFMLFAFRWPCFLFYLL